MKYWLFVVVLLLSPLPASGEEPPFHLPVQIKAMEIPGNAGMEFFYGLWESWDKGNHGNTMWFAPDRVIEKFSDTDREDRPYRVLFEAPNYVLLMTVSIGSELIWTSFRILTNNGERRHAYTPDPTYPIMNYHSCIKFPDRDGDEAFSWSREKLLEVFKSSKCGKGIHPNFKYGHIGDYWTTGTYGYSEQNPPKER